MGGTDASALQARILKRLRQVEELPPADQRTILKLVDALVVSPEVEGGSWQEGPAPKGAGPSI
jgi:hypothetical protein